MIQEISVRSTFDRVRFLLIKKSAIGLNVAPAATDP